MGADPLPDDTLLQRLAARINAAGVNPVPTPIAKFKRNYGPVLARASAGQLQVISSHGEQFILLSMAQVRNLMPPETTGPWPNSLQGCRRCPVWLCARSPLAMTRPRGINTTCRLA